MYCLTNREVPVSYTYFVSAIPNRCAYATKALVLGATGLAVQQALDPFGALPGRQLGVSAILAH